MVWPRHCRGNHRASHQPGPGGAHRFRVITIDPRETAVLAGHRRPRRYAGTGFVADTVAVMDAGLARRGVVMGISDSGWFSLLITTLHPERALGVVVGRFLERRSWCRGQLRHSVYDLDEVPDSEEG